MALGVGIAVSRRVGNGVDDTDHGVPDDLLSDPVATPHHGPDDGMRALTLMLHSLVQCGVELVTFRTEP